ncbi:hypothetical protein OIU84_017982 [Salix udensis]|uniref:GDSL esterase/lipase n=1 Tax=Salix udensis TaxID=889485 RepID=A0AAD6PL49_9ROSI|nr:hypothetical protein OIU84_017982 [Salix udensis]
MARTKTAVQVFTLLSILPLIANSTDFNYPAVFNFGDSNSDTGGFAAGLGLLLDPPYGTDLLQKPPPEGSLMAGSLLIF